MNRRSQLPYRRTASHRPVGRALPLLAATAALAACGGCGGVRPTAGAASLRDPPAAHATVDRDDAAGRTARVIVQFAPLGGAVVDPADPAFLATVAAGAGIRQIDLVRAMSGDAWVLLLTCDGGDDGCRPAIARLAASPAVRTVDVDRREHLL